MYELVKAGGNTWYIDCPAKVGLWAKDGEAILIDSGSDKDAGRRVRKILDEQGLALKAIVNTHSHADHIGGNAYLQKQSGCAIYAPPIEDAFTRYPVLEPTYLFGGCPPEDLRHKFLMAQPSAASVLTEEVLPKGFTIIPLPGHCFGQVGIRTPDDVVFVADSISSPATLEKYGVTVLFDVEAQIETLDKLNSLTAELFIPSHADPGKNIKPVIAKNISSLYLVADAVLGFCREPICFDDLLAKVFERYSLIMSMQQYVLVGSTIKSYLAWLRNSGKVEFLCTAGRLLWHTVQ